MLTEESRREKSVNSEVACVYCTAETATLLLTKCRLCEKSPCPPLVIVVPQGSFKVKKNSFTACLTRAFDSTILILGSGISLTSLLSPQPVPQLEHLQNKNGSRICSCEPKRYFPRLKILRWTRPSFFCSQNDCLNNIVNAERRGKRQVLIRPSSKVVVKFLSVMQRHGEHFISLCVSSF